MTWTPDGGEGRPGTTVIEPSGGEPVARRRGSIGWRSRGTRAHVVAAVALVGVALAIRIALIAQGWPGPADSDEGTMGLMARHIAYLGAHPLVFYGQRIIGAQEAYVGAALFHLLGPSTFTLRLGVVLLFVPFLAAIYLLSRLLYTRGLGLTMLLLFALGSPEMLGQQLYAAGHAETPLYCTALMLLAAWLALSAARPEPSRRRLVLGWTGWGLLAGFAIWADPLVTPFVIAGAALMLPVLRRPDIRRQLWPVVPAFVAGLAPLIYVLVSAIPSLLARLRTAPVGRVVDWHGHTQAPLSIANLFGTLTESLPVALGANAVCRLPAPIHAVGVPAQSLTIATTWTKEGPVTWPPSPCGAVHTAWAIVVIVLGVVAFRAALAGYRAIRRAGGDDEAATRDYARLALLGGAGLTLLLFTLSPAPAVEAWTTRRYLVGLFAAMPAVAWPLYRGACGLVQALSVRRDERRTATAIPGAPPAPATDDAGRLAAGAASRGTLLAPTGRRARPRRAVGGVVGLALLLALAASLGLGVAETFASVPAARRSWSQQSDLIAHLTALGATRIYTDYWTCDRLAFASGERIVCATLNAQLAPDLDRYKPYRAVVAAAPEHWYVFAVGSAQDLALARRAATNPRALRQFSFDGYHAYRAAPGQASAPGAGEAVTRSPA